MLIDTIWDDTEVTPRPVGRTTRQTLPNIRIMASNHQRIGTCPYCGAVIAPMNVLIEYETDDGVARFAECPECSEVAHPETT